MLQAKRIVPVLICLLAAAAVAGAGELSVELLPAAAGDLSARALAVPPAAKAAPEVPREAVAVSRPLSADETVAAPRPFTARSKEYQVEFSGAELAAGVAVYTAAPGALVRLNPKVDLAKRAGAAVELALDPARLVLTTPAGRQLAGAEAMKDLVDADKMAASGLPFPAGTSAFRLREDLGAGVFELRAEDLSPTDETRYLMQVREAASPIELTLASSRIDYLHGDRLVVEATLVAGGGNVAARRVEGFVTSPAGRAWPVTFRATRRGTYRATLKLDALEPSAPGLWEAHVSADGVVDGLAVLRGVRVAFGAAVPTARLDGSAAFTDGGFGVRLGVDVAAAGRYEVRGVLFGTAGDGTLRPLGVAQSAAWLEAGHGALELRFGSEVLAGAGLGAPYEVRDLQLLDQGRMGVLHRQDRGLVLGR